MVPGVVNEALLYYGSRLKTENPVQGDNKMAEGAGIEPTRAFSAHIGFEDQGDHQIPSASAV